MPVRRLFRLLVTVVATVLTAATAAFGALPAEGAHTPSFAGAGPAQLEAGAAEGLIRVPIGSPLGGYLRPPVGGDFIGGDPFGEATDIAPTEQADDGTPLAPLPDETRAVHSPYATYSPPSRGYYDALTAKAVALDDGLPPGNRTPGYAARPEPSRCVAVNWCSYSMGDW